MALFKISRGSKNNLPETLTEGYCWYTYDDSKFYIDFVDENGVLTRKALNAQEAEKLTGYDIATILTESDIEIPTSNAVLEAFTWDNLRDKPFYETYSQGMNCTFSNLTFSEYGQNEEGQTVYYATDYDESFSLTPGKTYVIDTPDERVATTADLCESYTLEGPFYGLVGTGNFGILTYEGYNTGEQVLIITDNTGNYTVYTLYPENLTELTVEAETYTVHPLDEIFIPDTIARINNVEEYVDNAKTEIQEILDTKANDGELAAIAKTGSTDDLIQGENIIIFDCGGAFDY